MPRLIDHEQRRVQVIEAAWRVLIHGGVQAVSVRNVATEAGLATASLRRAFPSQASLLAGCLELMGQRVEARIRALPQQSDLEAQARAILWEVLPLDEERRVEMEVYLSLGVAALSDPELTNAYNEVSGALSQLCLSVAHALRPEANEHQLTASAAALHAVVDGLALHLLHGVDATVALAALDDQLRQLHAA